MSDYLHYCASICFGFDLCGAAPEYLGCQPKSALLTCVAQPPSSSSGVLGFFK